MEGSKEKGRRKKHRSSDVASPQGTERGEEEERNKGVVHQSQGGSDKEERSEKQDSDVLILSKQGIEKEEIREDKGSRVQFLSQVLAREGAEMKRGMTRKRVFV